MYYFLLLRENIRILLRTNLNVQWQYENPLGRMHSDDKISSTVLDKSQLISKANCQAVDSPKKRTKEFAFFDLKSCYVVKSNAVRSFFWRI